MGKSDYFMYGSMTMTVIMLALFSWDGPKLRLRSVSGHPAGEAPGLPAPPDTPMFLTEQVKEFMNRDNFVLTRQKCDPRGLCVSCFVSDDRRRLLGETWTFCPSSKTCELLDTTEKKEQHDVPFGACERDEVPPVH